MWAVPLFSYHAKGVKKRKVKGDHAKGVKKSKVKGDHAKGVEKKS